MRSRLVALLGALALASALPGAALADTLPSGSFAGWRTPDCTAGPCTFTTLDVSLSDGVAAACVQQLDYDANGQEGAFWSGCADPIDVAALTVKQGYIVGLATTTVVLENETGTRSVDVSVSSEVSGSVKVSVQSEDSVDGNGCTISYTGKYRTVPNTGTITIDGASQGVSGESSLVSAKYKTRC